MRVWKKCELCETEYAIPVNISPQVCVRCWNGLMEGEKAVGSSHSNPSTVEMLPLLRL